MDLVDQNAVHVFRPQVLRDLARLAVESLALGVFVSLVLALAVFVVAAQTHAVEGGGPFGRDTAGTAPVADRAAPVESSPVGGSV